MLVFIVTFHYLVIWSYSLVHSENSLICFSLLLYTHHSSNWHNAYTSIELYDDQFARFWTSFPTDQTFRCIMEHSLNRFYLFVFIERDLMFRRRSKEGCRLEKLPMGRSNFLETRASSTILAYKCFMLFKNTRRGNYLM